MPRWLRVVLWVLAIAAAVVLLFTVVFPRVERILQNPTMDALGGSLVRAAPADGHVARSTR